MSQSQRFDAIGFDADDTLWDNERLYQQTKERFLDLLAECTDRQACSRRLDEIETHNVRYYGYGIKSFILSMIEAALQLSSAQDAAEKITAILGFAHDMLAAEVLLLDGAGETLAALAQQYPLLLITKGDPGEQKRKIDDSGLAGYFRWVEIVHDKTPETYRVILQRYGVAPERFLMVGNSPRSDILPVLRLGGQAILIPYENTWAHELSVDAGSLEYMALSSLAELPAWLARHAHRSET
jgi:putative hydrolase of the HAD superfamily